VVLRPVDHALILHDLPECIAPRVFRKVLGFVSRLAVGNGRGAEQGARTGNGETVSAYHHQLNQPGISTIRHHCKLPHDFR
jgi:hypothetical protein